MTTDTVTEDASPHTRRPDLRTLFMNATAGLHSLASVPLRFREITARRERLDDLELEFTFSEEQIQQFDTTTASAFVSYLGAWHAEHLRLTLSNLDAGVIADAWEEAREAFTNRFPDHTASEHPVLAVLRGAPDWDVTDVLLHQVTVKPYVSPFSRLIWQYSLLECPEWFYELLREHILSAPPSSKGFPLSAALRNASPEVREIVKSLWEDSPTEPFFDLEEVLRAADALL